MPPTINKNKYSKWYFNIIKKVRSQNRTKTKTTYYENHHIIPISLGGINHESNRILLTYREHFLCHWLITKFLSKQRDQQKMLFALSYMITSPNTTKRRFTSWQYETARIANKNSMIGNDHGTGNKGIKRTPWTKERKKEHSLRLTGVKKVNGKRKNQNGIANYMFGRYGKLHHGYGKPSTKESIEKMKDTKTKNRMECKYCHKIICKNIHTRFHGENCKENEHVTCN